MSTRWSTRLLFKAICVSSIEILAELNVDNVRAAADMPRATRSRNRLSRVLTSFLGKASRMSMKSFILSSMQAQLSSATSSTCVWKGFGHNAVYLSYLEKMFAGVASSCEKLNGTLMWMKCVEAAYFPDGQKRSCRFAGSTKLESSSAGARFGTALVTFILRTKSSRMKKT
jgi:hypothetical protein